MFLIFFFYEFSQNLQTPKKGTQQEQVQKVDGNLEKDAMTKKLKKAKLSQPQAMKDVVLFLCLLWFGRQLLTVVNHISAEFCGLLYICCIFSKSLLVKPKGS